MYRRIRLTFILTTLVAMTALMAPVQILAIRRGRPLRRRLPHGWHRIASRLLGLRVTVHGRPARHDGIGVLIAANHASWLDIVALGAATPVSFVAKHEIAGWSGVSTLAKLQETIFIERARRGTAGEQAARIRERLARGDTIVLFPEGTTSDGNFILPFKSALFGAVGVEAGRRADASKDKPGGDGPIHVQPVAIVYTRVHGVPMGRYDRPVAAWPGDVELGPHVLGVLAAGALDVSIIFGEPIVATQMPDRKALAAACEEAVRAMASEALRGRAQLPSGAKNR
ncbi:lysophospholipid acyltransferase family protein [Oricola sp.]|uniref:lysophospholipid acyltransferase family protein n=1 Tax=Oricola sp. TaxID=1979950 RepID=UPI0025D4986C|nr:lysophospholipid acyltransferase family protein [Oricola sp.]MCI5077893.1 1-acyl-sn-glycerol-3-phosphate acyltransferase [Oricola sp.]